MKIAILCAALLILSACTVHQSLCVQEKLHDEQLKKIDDHNAYQQGVVLATIQQNVSKDAVTAFLDHNNLTVKYDYDSLGVLAINVPPGTELEWICNLEHTEMISHGELDVILTTQQ